MKIVDAFCVFLPLDGRCNNNRRRRETKLQVLLLTLELEGVKFRNCVKQQNEDGKKQSQTCILEILKYFEVLSKKKKTNLTSHVTKMTAP